MLIKIINLRVNNIVIYILIITYYIYIYLTLFLSHVTDICYLNFVKTSTIFALPFFMHTLP